MNAQVIIHQAGKFLKRNLPTILAIAACCGVGGTVVVTAINAPKAAEQVRKDSAVNHDGDPDAANALEVVKSSAKYYIPTAVIASATMACVLGSNALNKRQNAALLSAYIMLDQAYKKYRDKFAALYGDEAQYNMEREIAEDAAREALEHNERCTSLIEKSDKRMYYICGPIGGILTTEQYFEATPEQVAKAEWQANQHLKAFKDISLNEVYDLFGLPPVSGGGAVGWTTYQDDAIIFSHDRVVIDEPLECIVISFTNPPSGDYLRFA